MTSRECVLAAIAHRDPDRVPVDLGATPSSGISAIAYGRAKRHLGLSDGRTRIYDVVQQLAQPEDAILDRFGIDVLDVGRTFNDADVDWYDVGLPDGQPAQYPAWFHPQRQPDGSWLALAPDGAELARMPAGGTFFDQACFPWADGYPDSMRGLNEAMGRVLWAALVHSPWDHAAEPGFWNALRDRALALRQRSDRALMIVCGCNLFEWGTFLRRLDNFLMDLHLAPDQVEDLLALLMQCHLTTLEKVCAAVGDVCDILRFGDDLGMDAGPFMSPDMYQDFFKPWHTELCAYVHTHSHMKTFLHSCGSLHALLPDLIEAGYDIINPVQTNCRNMEPERLKAEFGRDITFWGGGCDTRTVLNKAAPEEVRRHVLQRLDVLSPGGGFVFSAVHNILPDVPPQNVVAMFDAVREFNTAGG